MMLGNPTRIEAELLGRGEQIQGDAIRVGLGSVWLSNLRQHNVWRIDPRRVEATLPE